MDGFLSFVRGFTDVFILWKAIFGGIILFTFYVTVILFIIHVFFEDFRVIVTIISFSLKETGTED